MRILDRYILSNLTKDLICTILLFGSLLFIIEWLGRATSLLRSDAPILTQIEYMTFRLPSVFLLVTPFAFLFSTIYTFNRFEREKEIMAMSTSGVSFGRIFLPVLVFSLGLAIFTFFINEVIVVGSNAKASMLLMEIEGTERKNSKRNVSLYGWGGKRLYHFSLFDNLEGRIEGVIILDDRIRIDARMAKWQGDSWYLFDGVIRRFNKGEVERFDIRRGDICESKDMIWKALSSRRVRSENMGLRELFNYIEILRGFGRKISDKLTDLHLRFSLPFINIVIAIFGMGISFGRGGKIACFGSALLVGFLYWGTIALFRTLGHTGRLTPWLSAWAPNLIFLIIGGTFWMRR